jgi:hypothetical protein
MTLKAKKILIWGLKGLAIIAGIFLLVIAVKGILKQDNKYFDLLMESKDREIKAEQEHRVTLEKWNESKDAEIADLRKQDSVLKQKSQQVIIKYEKIPVTVNAYSYDELRRAVEEFGQ